MNSDQKPGPGADTGSDEVDTAGKLPGPASAPLSSYYGMPEAGRGSGATGDEALERAEDSDLASIGPAAEPRPAPGPAVPADTSVPDLNPFADGSEDPLAVPVDLERDSSSGRDD